MQNDIRKVPMLLSALWLCLYIAAGVLSGQFNVWTADLAPYVWLPAGVSLAAMLLSRASSNVPLAIAFALAQCVLSHLGGRDIPSALVLGALAGIAPLIASRSIRVLKVPLEGLHLLPAVLIAAFLSALLLGGGGGAFFALTKGTPFFARLGEWSSSIFVGVCIALPLLVVWAQFRPKRSAPRNGRRQLIGVVTFVAMVAITGWLFDSRTARLLDSLGIACPLYLPMFCVVIVAIACGARGGTLAVLALTLICLGKTAGGDGPFASQSAPASLSLLQAQLYVGVSAMLVLIVHALREAEGQAYITADLWRTDLELALAGSAQVAYTVDTSTRAVQWCGDVMGQSGWAAESLASVEDVLACVHPDDRARLARRWSEYATAEKEPAAPLPFRMSRAHANGEWLDMVDVGSSLSDGNGHATFVAGVWQRQPVMAG